MSGLMVKSGMVVLVLLTCDGQYVITKDVYHARCYQLFFRYRYFAGIRFAGLSVFRLVLLGV